MSHEMVASTLPPDSTLSLTGFEGAAVQRHSRGKKLRAVSVNNPVKSFDLLSNVFQERKPTYQEPQMLRNGFFSS